MGIAVRGVPAAGVEVLAVGPLQTNCYVVDDGAGACAVVDPGGDAAAIAAALGGRPVSLVLVTHAHFDHVGALDDLAARSRGGWVAGEADARALAAPCAPGARDFGYDVRVASRPSRTLSDGDVVVAGALRLRVLACPGHTPGGVSYIEDDRGLAFTGDTLFAGSAGRTDLDGGDPRALARSLARLAELPADTLVLPGHGPASTIRLERARNPYLPSGGGRVSAG